MCCTFSPISHWARRVLHDDDDDDDDDDDSNRLFHGFFSTLDKDWLAKIYRRR